MGTRTTVNVRKVWTWPTYEFTSLAQKQYFSFYFNSKIWFFKNLIASLHVACFARRTKILLPSSWASALLILYCIWNFPNSSTRRSYMICSSGTSALLNRSIRNKSPAMKSGRREWSEINTSITEKTKLESAQWQVFHSSVNFLFKTVGWYGLSAAFSLKTFLSASPSTSPY